jgi:hypothetical protein
MLRKEPHDLAGALALVTGACGMVWQPATPTPCSATDLPVLRIVIRLRGEVSFLSARIAATPWHCSSQNSHFSPEIRVLLEPCCKIADLSFPILERNLRFFRADVTLLIRYEHYANCPEDVGLSNLLVVSTVQVWTATIIGPATFLNGIHLVQRLSSALWLSA